MSAVNPQVTSVSFDKASYAPGQVITATVTYMPGYPSTPAVSGTAVATDTVTGMTGQQSAGFTVSNPDPTGVTFSDTGNRTWTKISDNGSTAVFTAIA